MIMFLPPKDHQLSLNASKKENVNGRKGGRKEKGEGTTGDVPPERKRKDNDSKGEEK